MLEESPRNQTCVPFRPSFVGMCRTSLEEKKNKEETQIRDQFLWTRYQTKKIGTKGVPMVEFKIQ